MRVADMVAGRHHIPTETKLTFAQYADEWLRRHKADLGPTTYATYETALRVHLTPAFGSIRLGSLTQRDIDEWRANEDEEAKRIAHAREDAERRKAAGEKDVPEVKEHGLSPASINRYLQVLNAALNKAVQWGYIARNPAQGVAKVPLGRNQEEDMNTLSVEQVGQMLEAAPVTLYPLLLTAVLTGLRRGELLALAWDDIDFGASKIIVRRSLNRIKDGEAYKLVAAQPKSRKSRRVDMPPEVSAALKELPSRFAGGLVFCQNNGKPLDPDNLVKREFAAVLRKAKLPRIRFHDLRHTYASLLFANGANVKYAQAMLGHSSARVTLDVYAHLMPSEYQNEAAKLGALVFGTKCDRIDTEGMQGRGQVLARA